MEQEITKDFFISYARTDQQWAEWIAWQLEEAGFTTILQAWDFQAAGNFVLDINKAATQAIRTIAVLSPDYFASKFTPAEWATAFRRDPKSEHGALIPVRVRSCDLEGLLGSIVYIDLINLDEAAAKQTLLERISWQRRKPASAPSFPSSLSASAPSHPPFPPAHTSTAVPAPQVAGTAGLTPGRSSVDVCIVCALPKEAQAFLRVVEEHCRLIWTSEVNRTYGYDYRIATLPNGKGELLRVHVSWLSRYGPQEMLLHLDHVIEEYQPCLVIMTGICAGNKQHVKLGDLVVADRTFTYDSGKFVNDEHGQTVHQHDTITYQVPENMLRFLGLFEEWKSRVAVLSRPFSKLQQRDWLLERLFAEPTGSVKGIPPAELEKHAPVWRQLVHELQQEPVPVLLPELVLRDKAIIDDLRYGQLPFPFQDPLEARCHIRPLASGSAVRSDNPFKDIQVPIRGAVAIDMEGAAFGRVMERFPGIEWLVVKGVSDYADSDKDDSYHDYAEMASAMYALCFIETYVTDERFHNCHASRDGPQQVRNILSLRNSMVAGYGDMLEYPADALKIVPSTTSYQPRASVRHDFYAHIPLSPSYIERKEVLTRIRTEVLAEISVVALTSALHPKKLNALHGMGGIGKTIIARALCDDPEIQSAFRDGILWITLGQEPDLATALRDLVHALGGTISENASTVNRLTNILATLLRNRACLLILDDVWRRNHAEVFLVGGPACRLLLTTRDAQIAHELRAKIQPIPVMTEVEAVSLLEEWADGHLAHVEPLIKNQIVKRLGYLPLAVKLAGAQLRRKSPDEWLETFDIRKLKSPRYEDIHDSLEVTFKLSLDTLDEQIHRLYNALAIFKEDEATPQVGIERLWQGLADLDASGTTDLLDDLASRALLEVIVSSLSQTRTILLHDLLRDLISIELGERNIVTHQTLLDVYRTTCQGTGWHTANDDSYLYNHLAYHLNSAAEGEELKELFANQFWLRARVPQQFSTYDGYLADLSLALECAFAETRRQIETAQELESFSDCVRYTLIRTGINSIAANYVPELIAKAVEIGVWTPDQAMSVASKIPLSEQQASTYLLLLETKQLSSKQWEKAQREAGDYALASPDEEAKARMLARLAPLQSEELFEQAVEAAKAMTNRLACAKLSLALLPQLNGERRTEILRTTLDAILAIVDGIEGIDLFIALVPHLTEDLLAIALDATLDETGRLYRREMLAALATKLTEKLLEQALEVILKIRDAWDRGECLRTLASYLPEPLLKQALQVTLATENEWARARMIAALASKLENGFLQQALENTLALSEDEARAWALAPLVGWCQLTGEPLERVRHAAFDLLKKGLLWPSVLLVCQYEFEDRDQMTQEILDAVLVGKYKWDKVEQLRVFSSLLNDEQLEQLLEVALKDDEDIIRHSILRVLVPYLKHEFLQRVLEGTLQEKDGKTLAYMLGELAPYLSESQLEQALQVALKIEDKGNRLRTLEELTPSLRDEQRDQACMHLLELILSTEVEHERFRAGMFVPLAPHLKNGTLKKALEVIKDIKDDWARKQMLTALVPQMSGELLEQVLQAASDTREEGTYLRTLLTLVPRLEDEQRYETLAYALKSALATTDAQERAQLLTQLVPHLEGKQRDQTLIQALEVAMVLPRELPRARLLLDLVPHLSSGHRDEVIASIWENVQELGHERSQVWILERLIPYLNDSYVRQVHQFASGIKDRQASLQLHAALAPRLSSEECDQVLTAVMKNSLEEQDERLRLRLLAMLAPLLNGDQRIQALARVIDLAQIVNDEQGRVEALVNVLSLLTEKQQQWAMQTIFTTSNQLVLLGALIKLAPHLHDEAKEQAVQVVLAMKDEWFRALTLAAFLPGVSDQTLFLKLIRGAMVHVLTILQGNSLQRVLNYLCNDVFMTPILSPKILGAIVSHIIEICQEWSW